MDPLLLTALTALGVGGATVIGALIGFLTKNISHRFSDIVLSFAAGVMLAAAVFGLIVPSLEEGGEFGILITVIGIFVGAFCLNLIDRLVPHLHKMIGNDIEPHRSTRLDKVLLFGNKICNGNGKQFTISPKALRRASVSVRTIRARLSSLQAVSLCKTSPKVWSLSHRCLRRASASEKRF